MTAKRRFQTVKGMRDLMQAEALAFAEVERTARRVFRLYDYFEVRTPIIEDTELFIRSVGEGSEVVGKQMYTFDDKKGRSLTLRPESTAAIARAYLEHDLGSTWTRPVKIFYMGPHFRYERPQRGRYRQFHQIGAELIGDPGPFSDVELLVMLVSFLEDLGFRNLVVGLNSVGDPECRQRYSRHLRDYLEPHRDELGAYSRRRLGTNTLRILDTKDPNERLLLEGAPPMVDALGDPARRHFESLCEELDRFNVDFEIDNRLVRGLDYYARTVFEISSALLGAQDAILGGGRYDGLIAQLGGPSVPGIGFAIGEDRLVSLLPEDFGKRIDDKDDKKPVCVVPMSAPWRRSALELAQELRNERISAICEFDALRPLKGGLKLAARRGCRWVVLVGHEPSGRTVVLRDFENSTQETIRRDEFVATVKARISA